MAVKHTWKYINHLHSREWRDFRRSILNKRGSRCERCGWDFEEYHLELHHNTYERLGKELDSDVELLCSRCHEKADAERKVESEYRSANALYWARVSGYAAKKYGEDYEVSDDTADEFDEWVEGRD